MKLPITDEVINAPSQYVGTFFYVSELSIPLTQRAFDQQCNEMLAQHVTKPVFEDFPEYVEWVRAIGNQFIGALEKDFFRYPEWWKKEPNVLKLQARIRSVIKAEAADVVVYKND